MTEQSKIPLPAEGEKGKSLFERAEGAFGLGGLKAAPVPEQLAEPANRRPARPVPHPQPEVPLAAAEPAAHATAPAASAPVPVVAPARAPAMPVERIEFTAPRQEIDRAQLRAQNLLVPDGEVTALVEEFRIVKRQILLAARDALAAGGGPAAQRVLVCSPLPGEGKTFCATNLALSVAVEKDIEVLLVDADFAKPSILSLLGLSGGKGLMDAFADPGIRVEDCVVATDIPNFYVLPAGNRTASDSEYLAAGRTADVLDRLTQGAPRRLVIFDSPPALAASPAAELANHVGQALVICRADYTGQSALEDALSLLSGCRDIKLLLNSANFSPSGRRFGTYYGYGGLTAMKAAPFRIVCALAGLCLPAAALAQDEGEDEASGEVQQAESRSEFVPYIEAMQVFTSELEPGNETVTYTSAAVGLDASIVGRNSAASVSLRYEHRFGWEDDDLSGDTISGVARAGIAVADGITLEAGGLAAQTRVEGNGFTSLGGFAGDDDSTSQVYSVYAGPSVHTSSGDVEAEGHYRLGYTRVEEPDALVTAPGAEPVDIFDESTTHSAYARVGTRPNTALPVGVGLGAGYDQQDVSNLDQRIVDGYVRGDVTVPVSPNVAFVGGVGYEDVEISSRDAVRDANGDPVIGDDGRYVTDEAAPRVIAYSTEGLIWDVGVMWRPSRRTALEFYVGERYGTMTYRGSFSYAPDSRSSFNVAVYDDMTGFGGMMVNQLAGLPAEFDAVRNAITGETGGCVAALQGNSCFANALGSVRSGVFRSSGIASSYSVNLGRTQFGVGVGYDHREYIAAAGTVLEDIDGVADETIWFSAYASTQLDEVSSLSFNGNASWFESELDVNSDVIGYSTSLAYQRDLIRGLSGTAAVGLDGISRENLPDFLSASALLGLRYSFF